VDISCQEMSVVDRSGLIALYFICTMLSVVAAFMTFLREVVLATVRIRTGPA